jgi:alpha-1,6-mannosyltransferase
LKENRYDAWGRRPIDHHLGLYNAMKRIGNVLTAKNASLVGLGIFSLASYMFAARLDADDTGPFPTVILIQVGIFLAAAWVAASFSSNRAGLVIILTFAFLFRLAVLFPEPQLSSDIYRYVWDGRVQGAGINPYRYIPSAPELAKLRDDNIFPNINRSDSAPTIYPPAAQLIFLAATRVSESVTWMKSVMMGFDLLTMCLFLQLIAGAGFRPERLLLYAWHPLVIWEFAGNGHVDAAMTFFVLLALWFRWRRKDGLTGVALALAALVKIYPLVLFPALYRRWNWRMPLALVATIVAAYLPYIRVGTRVLGFLPGYAKEEGLLSGRRFFLLEAARRLLQQPGLPIAVFAIFAAVILLALALWALWRREGSATSFLVAAFAIAATFTLLLSPQYSWYFAWLVPFPCFVPFFPIVFFTATAFYSNQTSLVDAGGPRWEINLLLYVPFVLLSLLAAWRKSMRGQIATGPDEDQDPAGQKGVHL